MIINMLGALLITKLPIFWGHAPCFAANTVGGISSTSHESSSLSCAGACSWLSSGQAPSPLTPT
jgi:hypothetical protein